MKSSVLSLSRISICLTILSLLMACSEEEKFRNVNFWTDMELQDESYIFLYLNDETYGEFTVSGISTSCGSQETISYSMSVKSKTFLEVRDSSGNAKKIGELSLGDFSDGLGLSLDSTNPDAFIALEGTSSDPCTLVLIRW